ncbi:MAG: hypothetical protein ABI972_22120, partial [Acidobacteriota bacterium]
TLNNLALLYSDTQRMREAEQSCAEAMETLTPLWQANPLVHGDQWGRCCGFWARLQIEQEKPADGLCALLTEALAFVYNPQLRVAIQGMMERLNCPPPTEDQP